MELTKGDRVAITGGKHKGRKANCLRAAGKVSCCVAVDGDTIQERTIRLWNVKSIKSSQSETQHSNNPKKDEMLAKITELSGLLEDLKLKVDEL